MARRAFPMVWTADDLERIPRERNRYEIIDGVLCVTPPPSTPHQRVVGGLYLRLRLYAEPLGLEVLMAPLDVRASPVTQVEPDLLALPRRHPARGLTRWEPISLLVLAVEVLSPSTAAVDRGRKRALYMSNGIDQYWIIDLVERSIEVWRPGADVPVRLDGDSTLAWEPVSGAEPLEIDLRALFDEAS